MLRLTSLAITGLLALTAMAPAQAAELGGNIAAAQTPTTTSLPAAIAGGDLLEDKAANRRHARSFGFGHRGLGHGRSLHHGRSHFKQKFKRKHHRSFGRHKTYSRFGHHRFSRHRNFRHR